MTIIHDPRFYKLGRKPKKVGLATPRMSSYIATSLLPAIPSAAKWGPDYVAWGMLLNDREGDCTCAGIGHGFDLWNAECGNTYFKAADADAQALYVAITGQEGGAFNPNTGENDNGCVEADVLAYVQKNGFAGRSLEAYAYVNPKDLHLIKATIWLFGFAYVGVALPISAQSQDVWDVTDPALSGNAEPGSWGGHCILLTGYDDTTKQFRVNTWGTNNKMLTYRWWLTYGDEAWGLLSPDWMGKNDLSPSQFNKAQLLEDMKLI